MMGAIADALQLLEAEAHADYRVLRRFQQRASYGDIADGKVGVFVDVESTGLNTDEDRIIQFAGVRFLFDSAGNIGQVGPMYSALEDPGAPLSREVTDITGLSDERLRGQKIDDGMVAALMSDAVLVIAHNADFDRKMIERRFSGFDQVAWACSQRDVKWEKFGCYGVKLEYLLMVLCSEFYEAHDALQDCLAGVHVLATPRLEDVSPFQMLLQSVRTPTIRLWAHESPYATKDRLRLRRYRWFPAPNRCWAKDLKADELEAERAWLVENVYSGTRDFSSVSKISAYDRYSVRVS
jgi:DNA polymerase-3 subunit epsilon